jgi:hypothetical protein
MALRIGGYSLTTPTIATPARIFYTYSCRDPNQKGSPFKSDQRVWESGKYPPTGTDLLDFGPNGRQGMKEGAELRRPLLNIPTPRWRAGTIARFFGLACERKIKGTGSNADPLSCVPIGGGDSCQQARPASWDESGLNASYKLLIFERDHPSYSKRIGRNRNKAHQPIIGIQRSERRAHAPGDRLEAMALTRKISLPSASRSRQTRLAP